MIMLEIAFILALSQEQIHQQCIYQAGVARHTQEIRQEGESWQQFKDTTGRMYKNDDGYQIILGLAYIVYHMIDADKDPDAVFTYMYDSCIAGHYSRHRKGPEFEL